MKVKIARIGIVFILIFCSGLNLIFPAEFVINTDVLFEDEVIERLQKENEDNSDLILLITHDDGGPLTNNLSRVQKLLSLEDDIKNNKNNISILSSGQEYISTLIAIK